MTDLGLMAVADCSIFLFFYSISRCSAFRGKFVVIRNTTNFNYTSIFEPILLFIGFIYVNCCCS